MPVSESRILLLATFGMEVVECGGALAKNVQAGGMSSAVVLLARAESKPNIQRRMRRPWPRWMIALTSIRPTPPIIMTARMRKAVGAVAGAAGLPWTFETTEMIKANRATTAKTPPSTVTARHHAFTENLGIVAPRSEDRPS